MVAAAVVRGGRLLVAQRGSPPELAGYWELPGGKVDHAEEEIGALVRECREELGVDVRPIERVGVALPIADSMSLHVWYAECDGEPRATEHLALAWVAAGEIDDLDWLPADRALVPMLRALLTDARPGGPEHGR